MCMRTVEPVVLREVETIDYMSSIYHILPGGWKKLWLFASFMVETVFRGCARDMNGTGLAIHIYGAQLYTSHINAELMAVTVSTPTRMRRTRHWCEGEHCSDAFHG